MHKLSWPGFAFRLAAASLAALSFIACDTRKPIDADGNLIRPPILELSAEKEAVGVDKDTSMAVRVRLVNALHGTLSLREIRFTAKIGFIASADTTNDSGVAQVLYYTRNRGLTEASQDTLTATFSYANEDGEHSVSDTLILRLIPGAASGEGRVGSIELSTSRTSVQVKGSGNTDQSIISARVFDLNHAASKDGTKVTFQLLSGPGGGETLGAGATDTASTKDGVARVTFHGGTAVGVVEILASSGSESIKQALLTVTSGPPEHVDITVLPDSLVTDGKRWRLEVQAAITDAYLNPVKDSISVVFSLAAKHAGASSLSILGSGFTGNSRCKDTAQPFCKRVLGSAFSTISYRSEVIYDTLIVTAETKTGSLPIRANLTFLAPLQKAVVKANYFGGGVKLAAYSGVDTVEIVGALADGFGYAIPAGRLCISTDGGEVEVPCKATDAGGFAYFSVIVDTRDQTSLNKFKPITATLTEPASGANDLTTFTVIFE
jgi:hypothetical protein